MNELKQKKQELVMNGTYERYLQIKKDFYNEGYSSDEIPNIPATYFVNDEELKLLIALEKSQKKTKYDFRAHAYFMSEYYDNVALLTLTFSNKAIECTKIAYKKKILTSILKSCFEDYIGKFELSRKGRIHAHLIVAWNGPIETFKAKRQENGKWITITLAKKMDLQEQWYGENNGNDQPTKYGVYELEPIRKTRTDTNKAANYTLKSLNTLESYIDKTEALDDDVEIDQELLIQVNTSNIIVARNTPYQRYKRDKKEQDKLIRRKARVFESSFYDENKFNSNVVFREWAEENKNTKLTDYLNLFEDDFKIVSIEDY